jgi:hypothetical protein
MALEDRYRELAFTVSQATGEATKWREVQKTIEPVADAVKRTSSEMATAYDALIGKSTNAQFSAQALSLVGEAMNATGRSAEELGTLVGTLNKKWGITDMGEVRLALMQLFEASKSIKFDELAEDLDEVGSIAKSAGMNGIDGFRRSLGLAAAVAPSTNRTFSEVLTGMDQLTEKMRQMPVWQGLAKAGKFEGKKFFDEFVAQPDAMNRVRMMLEQAGKKGSLKSFAREAIEVEFTGREERAAYKVLADPFMAAYEEAKAAGKSSKEATEAGVAAFDAGIAKLGQTTGKWSDIQDRAADNQNATSSKIRQAQEMFQRAFTDPKTMGAMGELAEKLPALAEGIAKLISFTVENPLLTGATFVGSKAALAGATGFIGTGVKSSTVFVAEKSGTAIAGKFTDAVASSGVWKGVIGPAVGVAAGAAAAYALGQWAIDKYMGEDLDQKNKGDNAAAIADAAIGTGNKEQMVKALAEVRTQQKELEKGPGIITSVMGGIANVVTGGDVKSAGEQNLDTRARLAARERELLESIAKSGESGDKAGRALERMATATDKAARALSGIGRPSGSNGLPPTSSKSPGFLE